MRVQTRCLECIVRQTRVTAELCTQDRALHERALKEVLRTLARDALDRSPAEHSQIAYTVPMRLTGAADPFAQSKREQNQAALEAYPSLKDIVARADDPLHTAAKLAAAGNIIDLGTMAGFDVGAEVSRVLAGSFAVDHYTVFRRELAAAPSLLYLCDNCGEVVFDRLFLETIHALYPQVALTAVVKSGPIINDATLRDARDVALDRAARVVASGGALIGTPYREVSPEVRELLRTSAIVIAKGQGNFETSSALPRTMYFILKAKCPCVASELSVDFGDVVFLRHEGSGAWNDPA